MKKVAKTLLCLTVAMMMMGSMAFAATFTGTVDEDDSGLVLMADDQTYMLEGEGLDEFIGENVNVTGEVSEKDGNQVIMVGEIKIAE